MYQGYEKLEHRKRLVIDACKKLGPLTARQIGKIMKYPRPSEAVSVLKKDPRIKVDAMEPSLELKGKILKWKSMAQIVYLVTERHPNGLSQPGRASKTS